MAYLQGKNVLFQIYRDDDYLDFLCATDMAINVATETKSTKTVGDGQWKDFEAQVLGYDVSLNGIFPIGTTNVDGWEILNNQMLMRKISWRMVFRDAASSVVKVARGQMLPIGTGLTATPIEFIHGNFSFTGTGALLIEDSIPACDATILSVSLTPPTFHASPIGKINYYGFTAAPFGKIDYTLDGGGRLTVLSPPTSWFFYVNVGNPAIDHALVLIPVCQNGLDGTPYPFTITHWYP